MVPNPTYSEEMIPSILILKLKHQKRVLLRELPSLMTKTKGQGSRGNVPPTNRKKVSPRKHLGLGSFSLACDRAGWSTGESQKGKKDIHGTNLKNSDSTISVSLTGVSPPLGNPYQAKQFHKVKIEAVSIHSLF